MAHKTPILRNNTLYFQQEGQQQTITVGTPDWYTWLKTVSTFAFSSEHGSFTARKEQPGNRRGGEYWKAYRMQRGKLRRAYLGKSETLTLERLNEVAAVLAGENEVNKKPESGKLTRITAANPTQTLGSVKARHSNIPTHLAPLIGREQDMEAVCTLLKEDNVRLLTLVGTGGVGKTSLALRTATELLNEFPDGIYFVSLAPISDPALVVSAIAQALGVREGSNQSLLDQLKAYLHSRHLLLILDNFEQVVTAAPLLAELMRDCLQLKLLVTSRELLQLREEHSYLLSSLALPDVKQLPTTESLPQYAAVALFIQRTQAVKPGFRITEASARAVVDICVRLDGLPLAIELAAARMRLLSPQQLLARLGQSLQVLTGGARDLPERQQTLRNTIKWSYDLLNAEEQQLFRRLAIFVQGCSIEAAESVSDAMCRAVGDEAMNVLDAATSLLDKHLMLQREQSDGESRLLMLETIREFGLECLHNSGEYEIICSAHAGYFQAMVEATEPNVFDAKEMAWFERLEQDHDNLRAALQWFIESEESEMALKLSGSLVRFWGVRGYMREARQWLERAFALREGASSPVLAKALSGAGWLATEQGNYEQAEALCNESLMLFQKLGDERGMALALHRLGGAYSISNYTAACSALEESLILYRKAGDKGGLAYSLMSLGAVNTRHSENAKAHSLLEESLVPLREINNKEGMAWSLFMLALALFPGSDTARANSLLEESLTLFSEISNKEGQARTLSLLGQLKLKQGEYITARPLLEESLALFREVASQQHFAQTLLLLARTAALQLDKPAARAYYEECLTIMRELGDERGIAACIEGLKSLNSTQAHTGTGYSYAYTKPSLTYPAGLTAREVEVLRLVASGLTNAQIAEQLVISPRTVNAHMRSIYNKLEISSRTAVTRYAVDQHLV
jgi:predicted ATPase/DNA-binding CsgD family transcriptional regulator